MIEAIDRQLAPLERELRQLARRQTGCRALMRLYGIGELTAPYDPLRARRRDAPVGLAQGGAAAPASTSACTAPTAAPGSASSPARARRSCAGRSTSQPQAACRPSSPDHADYLALKARGLSHTRASLTIARKLARRSFHTLRELGPAALEPVT